MIKLEIKVSNGEVFDHLDTRGCTLQEVASAVYRLEQIKKELVAMEFESNLESNENDP